MTAITRATRIGTGFWRLIRLVLKVGVVTIFVFLALISAVFESIETRDAEPIIRDVGGRILIATNGLNLASLEIIDDFDNNSFWGKIKLIGLLIGSFVFVWAWIKILTWIAAHTPIHGDTSRVAINYGLGVVGFFFLQYFFILLVMSGTLDVIPGVTEVIESDKPLLIPIIMFQNAGLAIGLVSQWIVGFWD